MNVIHQARVIFIHHGQFVAGGAHVQAAHGCGLLQQDDGKEIVHEDLQDLAKFQRKNGESLWQQDPGTLPDYWNPMRSIRTTPTNFIRGSMQRKGLIERKEEELILRKPECSPSDVTKVVTSPKT